MYDPYLNLSLKLPRKVVPKCQWLTTTAETRTTQQYQKKIEYPPLVDSNLKLKDPEAMQLNLRDLLPTQTRPRLRL